MNTELLKKAFDAANSNDLIRQCDEKTRFTVLSDMMMQYGLKNDVNFSRQDVDTYIKDQYEILEDAISDFKYSEKMMY
ncbi:MAG: hypothetical protein PHH48_02490 [Eubacteriales bacterium]|nr:hypothetical protein [Eubacteriales bacterium]